jgi:hypothetical protein
MIRRISSVLVVLVTAFLSLTAPVPAEAGWTTVYENDFESYPVRSGIDGVDGWTSITPYNDPNIYWGTTCWQVVSNVYSGYGGTPNNYLIQGFGLNSVQDADYATLHLNRTEGWDALRVGFSYCLQPADVGTVAISGDGISWIDVTSLLGITPRYSNDFCSTQADLSSQIAVAGIDNDLYLRFSAWNPTSSGVWWEFRIDNVRIESVPEPSSIALFLIGAASLLGYAWRRA